MKRWRVDFKVKSNMVLVKDQKNIVFNAPDGSHEIHLLTKRGEGKHAADELYLSAHVILEGNEPQHAADEARKLLWRFLDVLSFVTSAYYRITERTLVVDWSPGLTERSFLLFKIYPDPNMPIYGMTQGHLESVARIMKDPIAKILRLAISWWAQGVNASPASNQFQYFWYSLEILSEHTKSPSKVASKCPACMGDLYCPKCKEFPLHRPFPKQAIQMLIQRHVTGQPDEFFKLIDEARNRLLHGEDPTEIEQALKVNWEKVSDAIGKATWAAICSNLLNLVKASAIEGEKLSLVETNTYAHSQVILTSSVSMGVAHVDPSNPQIEEFEPSIKLDLVVSESEKANAEVD